MLRLLRLGIYITCSVMCQTTASWVYFHTIKISKILVYSANSGLIYFVDQKLILFISHRSAPTKSSKPQMISIIPKPQHLQLLPGDILLSTPIKMAGINGLLENLDSFPSIFGSLFQPASAGSKAPLLVDLDPGLESDIGAEGYRLNIQLQTCGHICW